MLKVMGGISDVDTSALQLALKRGDQAGILYEGGKLKKIGKHIYSLDLLDNPMAVAKQYSMAEAEGVQNAILFQKWANKAGVSSWSNVPLAEKAKRLNFEINWLPNNHAGKVWEKTWEVSLKAYQKELLKVQDAIDWNDILSKTSDLLSFKTKSKYYIALKEQLTQALAVKDKALVQSLISDMQIKREGLEK